MIETRRRPAEARRIGDRDRPRILVVDDEELIRETLAEYLTQEGFAVTACASGEQAVDEARRQAFAIALCDM